MTICGISIGLYQVGVSWEAYEFMDFDWWLPGDWDLLVGCVWEGLLHMEGFSFDRWDIAGICLWNRVLWKHGGVQCGL